MVLVLFNQIHWVIAGISIRPSAAHQVVFGILWGPAATWDLGIGNLTGDLTGSWSPMYIFGFLINFLYPYLSYLLWHRLMKGHGTRTDSYSLGCFLLVTFVITLVCMTLLAACGTIFFARPFESKFISYFSNNILWTMTIGRVIFWMVLEKAAMKGFVYGREWNQRKAVGETG